MMQRIAIFAGILALLFAVPALAQVGSDWGSGGFKNYNTSEGDESGQAGQATSDRSFAEVDRNGDGSITQSELEQTFGDKATEQMSTMDQDGDGALSQQEYGMMGMSGGPGGSGGSSSGK